ncbi:hypothetical protein BDV19DRAFT_391486 [Aspergillus venezuelensis]
MDGKQFFDGWVDRLVELGNPDQPSTWRLVEKLGDKNTQLTAEEYNVASEFNTNYQNPSAAYGAFRCQNTRDPDDVAFMKIIMQSRICFEYRACGVKLSENEFWDFEDEDRHRLGDAFRVAWE